MRSKPSEFYNMARRAFKALHGYWPDPGELGHQKFMAGWQQGFKSAQRRAKRVAVGKTER